MTNYNYYYTKEDTKDKTDGKDGGEMDKKGPTTTEVKGRRLQTWNTDSRSNDDRRETDERGSSTADERWRETGGNGDERMRMDGGQGDDRMRTTGGDEWNMESRGRMDGYDHCDCSMYMADHDMGGYKDMGRDMMDGRDPRDMMDGRDPSDMRDMMNGRDPRDMMDGRDNGSDDRSTTDRRWL